MSRRLVGWGLTGGAVLLAVALRFTVFRDRGIEVDIARAEVGTVEQTVTNSRAGTVKAKERARLSPESGGRVVAIPKRKGERVRAGEAVLVLDGSVEAAERAAAARAVAAAAATERQACVNAARAERERQRLKRLAAEQIVSVDAFDEADSAARAAADGCTAARADQQRASEALQAASSALAKRTLRAPFDGIVADVNIEVGEWATPALPGLPVPPLVDILDPRAISFEFEMDEVDADRLHVGLPARVTVDAVQGMSFAGHVVRVAPYVLDIEKQNRTVEIEVELDDRSQAARLLPGSSADVEVVLATRNDVLRVPTSAILSNDRVLVVAGDRLAERRIETGLRNWDWTEARSGLAAGDRVVVSLDRPEVKPGARVAKANERTVHPGAR
ncbi:MAG: efflux RND transporter periplasmic adaptor subunit [Acidobacteriota bacterium]